MNNSFTLTFALALLYRSLQNQQRTGYMRAYNAQPEARATRLKRSQRYYAGNKEKCLTNMKFWSDRNPEKRKKIGQRWVVKELATNPSFKIGLNLRHRIYMALINRRLKKSAKTLKLVGCPIDQLRRWLEAKFSPGMTWENYGDWHVDHIRPCASFDLSDPEQQKQCFHYSNLQPLWETDNLSKGAKWLANA